MKLRVWLLTSTLLASSLAVAQPTGDTAEAGKRFSAGVALYNEADYRAALVEFQRAYETAPNPVVLYNIGQTQYQLQDYAKAFTTLTRFMKEAPADAEHRSEVEQTITLLQARIGKIEVSSDVVGAEITIDDELVGKTPMEQPVLVSVGRRKVRVTAAGRQNWERTIDVAAGDTVRQDITLPSLEAKSSGPVVAPEQDKPFPVTKVGWITTGVLAAGAITFGVLAYSANNKLDDLKDDYPVSKSKLSDQSDKVGLYSHIGDGLGIAAIAVGGATLIYMLTSDSGESPAQQHVSSTHVGIGPSGFVVVGTF
ncbi:MAG TPA: PEGA domain-containing protein [Kofleriaceae bacterium]|jgi:tetratricopeptide (TPR) repeat protein